MAGESARETARRSRAKAAALTRRAEAFDRGADGEAATAALLDSLAEHGWQAMHDLRWPGRQLANIDHIATGPGGIFVIDSKNWSGRIRVEDSVLRQDGRSREPAVAGCAEAAAAVAACLPSDLQKYVIPVLAFVTDQPLTGWARDVMVCSSPTLAAMLTSRPRVLSPGQVAEVRLLLDASLQELTRPVQPARPHYFSAQPVRRPSRTGAVRRTRARRRTEEAIIGLVTVALITVFGPRVIQQAASSDPPQPPVRTEHPRDTPPRDDAVRPEDRRS